MSSPAFSPLRPLVALIAVFVTAAVLALSLPAAAQSEAGTGDDYRLGTGDRVRVTVFGQEQLSGEYEVDATGHIAMPLVSRIQAQNRTAGELETTIATALTPDFLRDPQVSVEVLSYRPFYILGEIRQPGSYPYVNGMTVWNAVALAGGFTYRARKSTVTLRRGDSELRVPLDSLVQPGDVIEIRERFF